MRNTRVVLLSEYAIDSLKSKGIFDTACHSYTMTAFVKGSKLIYQKDGTMSGLFNGERTGTWFATYFNHFVIQHEFREIFNIVIHPIAIDAIQ